LTGNVMPFSRPTLDEIVRRNLADAASRLTGTVGTVLRRSVLGVIMRIVSGASHLLHGHIDWVSKQIIPDTAESEYLNRWANIWGVFRLGGEQSSGTVTVSGAVGSVVTAGSILQRADGVQYAIDASVTIPMGGSITASVTALLAGSTADADNTVSLSFVSPLAGINTTATVIAISGGADVESDDALRARLIARISNPPQGGSAQDYEQWALAVAGVTRAWVSPVEMGPGTVTVRFVRDGDASIYPDAGEVAEVQAYIDERRPVTADVYVVAPNNAPLNLTIQIAPNNASVQSAITAELEDLIFREAEPGGTLLLSRINEAISSAQGETDHILVAPSANVVSATGDLVSLGTITFQNIP
jgi:uncharacterized phage protein gp47/JayE